MRIGFGLSCEEFAPADLVRQARLAEDAGFSALWISDHYHPWTDAQGHSPFVWSIIGALSQATGLPITTGVTCPIMRIHPAVIAQAAATSAVLSGGRFTLGVGTGEALNEHILGDAWPAAAHRLEMLEEAIEVMRALWSGRTVHHHGKHFTVEHARLYTVPEEPVPISVSGLGARATDLAARVGDGYISVKPAPESVRRFRANGGADKPAWAGAKACYADTEDEARHIAHRLWATDELPGELARILPTPKDFEQAASLITPDMMRMACGPDPQAHLSMVAAYRDAGYDTVFIAPVGPHCEQMIDLYRREIIPAATDR